jgi:glycosyltransferase involved in cell wall biosynthesis
MESVYEPECIIDALKILSDRGVDFKMTFVGGGPLSSKIENMTELLGLRNHIDFMGQVQNSMLPDLLADHHVYLSASKWDGTSLSLIEAMASGLFPIVSNIESNKAWIKNGKNGDLFNLSDPESMASSIEKYSKTPRSLDWQVFNRELVAQKGNLQNNMHKLKDIFESVCMS